jgi:hypothetical protein
MAKRCNRIDRSPSSLKGHPFFFAEARGRSESRATGFGMRFGAATLDRGPSCRLLVLLAHQICPKMR